MTKILNKREIFRGRVVRVEEVDLDFSGHKTTFELINFNVVTGVSALPIDEKGQVVLIKHFQVGLGEEGWSLPTGGLAKGENPLERMQLELQEEIGFKAGKLTLMTRVHTLPGYIGSEPGYIYLAQDLAKSRLKGDEDYLIKVVHVPVKKALSMVKSGEIVDGRTMLALLYFKHLIPGS